MKFEVVNSGDQYDYVLLECDVMGWGFILKYCCFLIHVVDALHIDVVVQKQLLNWAVAF
jgi:hypothetical protein